MLISIKPHKVHAAILNKKQPEKCEWCQQKLSKYSLSHTSNYISKNFTYVFILSFNNYSNVSCCSHKCVSNLTTDITLFLSVRTICRNIYNILSMLPLNYKSCSAYYDHEVFIYLAVLSLSKI